MNKLSSIEHFMNPVASLVCSQDLGTGSYLESLNSIVHSPILFLFNIRSTPGYLSVPFP